MSQYVIFDKNTPRLVLDYGLSGCKLSGELDYIDNVAPKIFDVNLLQIIGLELFFGGNAKRYKEIEIKDIPSSEIWVKFKGTPENGMFKVYPNTYSRNKKTNNKNVIKPNKTIIINGLGTYNWECFVQCDF